ncbi:MAG: hypothetical protein ACRD03_02910 [Acidimicrobiales bacterium]
MVDGGQLRTWLGRARDRATGASYCHDRLDRMRADVDVRTGKAASAVDYLGDEYRRMVTELEDLQREVAEVAMMPEAVVLAQIRAEVTSIRVQAQEHYDSNQARLDEFRQLLNDFAESTGRISHAARRFRDGL